MDQNGSEPVLRLSQMDQKGLKQPRSLCRVENTRMSSSACTFAEFVPCNMLKGCTRSGVLCSCPLFPLVLFRPCIVLSPLPSSIRPSKFASVARLSCCARSRAPHRLSGSPTVSATCVTLTVGQMTQASRGKIVLVFRSVACHGDEENRP